MGLDLGVASRVEVVGVGSNTGERLAVVDDNIDRPPVEAELGTDVNSGDTISTRTMGAEPAEATIQTR